MCLISVCLGCNCGWVVFLSREFTLRARHPICISHTQRASLGECLLRGMNNGRTWKIRDADLVLSCSWHWCVHTEALLTEILLHLARILKTALASGDFFSWRLYGKAMLKGNSVYIDVDVSSCKYHLSCMFCLTAYCMWHTAQWLALG